jgi:hypothetical protein
MVTPSSKKPKPDRSPLQKANASAHWFTNFQCQRLSTGGVLNNLILSDNTQMLLVEHNLLIERIKDSIHRDLATTIRAINSSATTFKENLDE